MDITIVLSKYLAISLQCHSLYPVFSGDNNRCQIANQRRLVALQNLYCKNEDFDYGANDEFLGL